MVLPYPPCTGNSLRSGGFLVEISDCVNAASAKWHNAMCYLFLLGEHG